MDTRFSPGDNVYFIANAIFVKEAQIVKCAAGSCIIRFTDRSGGTRLRENRLYRTSKEAKANIRMSVK